MAAKVVMPRLGWTMEEGILNEWLKRDGDEVQAGEIIFTVESDKAINEVEAFESGILRIPPDSPPVGTTLKVGALLAYIVQPGEAAPFEGESSVTESAAAASASLTNTSAPRVTQDAAAITRQPAARRAISPRARRAARELGIDWETISGSGSSGRIIERDIRAAAALHAGSDKAAALTPVARRVAADRGIDADALAAAMPGKRIRREDVEASAAARQDVAAHADRLEPLSAVRQIIAQRMSTSAHTTASVTLTMEVDATELVILRQQLKRDAQAESAVVPTYNDLFVKLLGNALTEHPLLNARIDGDSIRYFNGAHIGVAVDTPRGLLVPVLRDVQNKSVRQIARESAEIVARAREGKLSSDMLSGGTFSLTNLGMFEIDAFTPIINLPECAILGIGRIVPKQIVIDADAEKLAIRRMMFMSLTFDHRLVDGAPAARFMQRVKQFVEQPYLWLVG